MENLIKVLDKAKANKKLILVKVYDEENLCEGNPDCYALDWEIGSDKLPVFPECKGEDSIEILYIDNREYQLYYKDKDTTKINEKNIIWILNREEWESVMNVLLGDVLYHGQLPDDETWFKQYRQELTNLFFEVREEIIEKNLSVKQIGEYLVRAEADMIGNSHLVNKCSIDQEQLLFMAGKIKSLVTGLSSADIRLNPTGREAFIYLYAEDYENAIWEQYCEILNISKDEREVRINFDKADIVTGTQMELNYMAVYGPNTKQWYVYDELHDVYIDIPVSVLNEISVCSEDVEVQEEYLNKLLKLEPVWLYDKDHWYTDIEI